MYRLSKKYRRIRSDIQPVIEEIQRGNFLGDRLTGMGEDFFIFIENLDAYSLVREHLELCNYKICGDWDVGY